MKNTKRIRQQMHEILDICLDCNGFESRARRETGTMPTVFFDFSGHVSRLKVMLYPDGWCGDGYCKTFEFSTNQDIDLREIESLRTCAQHALTEKKESEVIARSILAKEEEIRKQKASLKTLRDSLKKAGSILAKEEEIRKQKASLKTLRDSLKKAEKKEKAAGTA